MAGLAAAVALTGCSGSDRAVDGPAAPTAGAIPRSVAPSPTTDCFAPIPGRRNAYAPVSCDDPTAEARELLRANSSLSKDGKYLAECPEPYDFAIDIDAKPAVRATSSPNRRFACVRRLKPPHAEDPGQGRAPIVEGDCVYEAEALTSGPIALKSVVEIPCSEAPAHKPAYRVFQLEATVNCPKGRTDLTFVIGPLGNLSSETSRTGCARKL